MPAGSGATENTVLDGVLVVTLRSASVAVTVTGYVRTFAKAWLTEVRLAVVQSTKSQTVGDRRPVLRRDGVRDGLYGETEWPGRTDGPAPAPAVEAEGAHERPQRPTDVERLPHEGRVAVGVAWRPGAPRRTRRSPPPRGPRARSSHTADRVLAWIIEWVARAQTAVVMPRAGRAQRTGSHARVEGTECDRGGEWPATGSHLPERGPRNRKPLGSTCSHTATSRALVRWWPGVQGTVGVVGPVDESCAVCTPAYSGADTDWTTDVLPVSKSHATT